MRVVDPMFRLSSFALMSACRALQLVLPQVLVKLAKPCIVKQRGLDLPQSIKEFS
jgi:hypothetical protein